jgi:transposase InsO family protein
VKYAFIKAQQSTGTHSVSLMCEVFKLSASAYYEWLKQPVSQHAREDQRLAEKINVAHQASRGTYGARRIREDLLEQGEQVSRARVGRLMKENDLKSKMKQRFKATTDSAHSLPVAPNHLERRFHVDTPDTVYVGDITYIPTQEGWLYLAVLIDLYSRAVVGWAMASHMKASLANDALLMATFKRRPAAGLLVHSDRGSQYASHLYQKTLNRHRFVCSMSRKGNCWDNAPAESFFHTLKTELCYQEVYSTRDHAKQAVFEYIEVFYNQKRRHSSIGYVAPLKYEQMNKKAA